MPRSHDDEYMPETPKGGIRPEGPGDDEHKGEHEFKEAAEIERKKHGLPPTGPRLPPELDDRDATR